MSDNLKSVIKKIERAEKNMELKHLPEKSNYSLENMEVRNEKVIKKIRTLYKQADEALDDIEFSLLRDDSQKVERAIKKFLSKNEAAYLQGKDAKGLTMKNDIPKNGQDLVTLKGEMADFPAELIKLSDSYYKFFLPPMLSKRTVEKSVSTDGKAVRYIVKNLINEYERTHEQIPMMKRPSILFIHLISNEKRKQYIPDSDNLDVKSVLDTLQGIFIKGDSVLDIVLLQAGRLSEINGTEVYIMDTGGV